MAVDRWFFGIPVQGNANNGAGGMSSTTKDTYIIDYSVTCTDASAAILRILATIDNDIVNPSSKQINIIREIVSGVIKQDVFFKIDRGTLYFMKCDPLGTSGTIKASYTVVELPASGKTRSRADVIAEIKNGNSEIKVGYFTYAAGTEFFLEYSVGGKQIIQPVQQAAPAVANELNLVSTSSADAAAGTGAREITFDYVDGTLDDHDDNVVVPTGTTPFDLHAAGYNDVFYIKRAYVSAVGILSANQGDILFQDDA